MPTSAERKALLFLAVVATLGASVRCWRTTHSSAPAPSFAAAANEGEGPRKSKKKSKKARRKTDDRSSQADSNLTVDLDVASEDEIDALGLLKPGQARQIVSDRREYGPFGSIQALERIPYFPKSAIVKLAPRVTFSRLPRPSNAVIQRRSDTIGIRRNRRRRPSDVAP